MKTQKINKKNVTNAAIMALGFSGGIAASGALGGVIDSQLGDNAEFGKIGLAGAGLLGGTMLKDNDELGTALKSLSLGVAAKQIYDLATGAIKGSVTVKPEEERGIVDTLAYGALGLGCPGSDTRFLAAPVVNFPQNDVVVLDEPDWGNAQEGQKAKIALLG